MELVKFHISDPATRPPRHGNTITAGNIRIRGVLVNLTGTTGGKGDKAAADHLDLFPFAVPYIYAFAAVRIVLAFYHIDGIVTLKNMNIGMLGYRFVKRDLQRFAGGIGGMQDAAEAMPALAGEVIAVFAVIGLLLIKGDAMFD